MEPINETEMLREQVRIMSIRAGEAEAQLAQFIAANNILVKRIQNLEAKPPADGGLKS